MVGFVLLCFLICLLVNGCYLVATGFLVGCCLIVWFLWFYVAAC